MSLHNGTLTPEDMTLTRDQIWAIVDRHRGLRREMIATQLRIELEAAGRNHETIDKVISDLDSYL